MFFPDPICRLSDKSLFGLTGCSHAGAAELRGDGVQRRRRGVTESTLTPQL
jgi:hypothetical protein